MQICKCKIIDLNPDREFFRPLFGLFIFLLCCDQGKKQKQKKKKKKKAEVKRPLSFARQHTTCYKIPPLPAKEGRLTMRSAAALVAVAALPMVAAMDTCQLQTGSHTNAICCAAGTSYSWPAPGAQCEYSASADKCQSACCKSTCLSKSVTCPAGYVKKAAYDTTASAASDSAAAATAACCERTCTSMSITCPEGKSPVAWFDTLVCADQAACETKCCRRTCASAPARACTTPGLAPRAKYATIECPAGGGPCVEVTCCERTCKSMSITCPEGKSPVAAFDTLACLNQADCETKCCRRTCASAPARACTTAGLVQRAMYATIECPAGGGPCVEAMCCEGTCKSKVVTCGTGYVKLAAFDTIVCPWAAATCVDLCCERTCTHADHSATVCAAIGARTFQLKKESAEIACSTGRTTMPGLADKCDNQLCCDLTRVARDVATVRATLPHTLVSCVENADCRKHGDAGATCDTTTNECTCTNCDDYNFASKDTFEWLNVRCYRKKETHRVSLIFTRPTTVGDVCHPATATNPIPKDVRAAVVAVYETFSGGKVVSAAFQCISRKVSVSLQVEVVRGAVLNTDKNGYNAAMAGQTIAIRSKLGGALEALGTAGPCPGLPNVAKRLSVAGTCLVQKCDVGYYKHKDSRACTQYVAGTTAAADEYDHCTADEDCTWRSHVGWCVDSKCVLSLDTYQRKLKKPTASAKDWCTDDASCRAFGDVAATCSTNVGLGNWCSCVDAAYDYPAGDAVGLCAPTAATAITLGFVVTYETGLACPTTEAQVESFTALIRKVLGDTGAKVAHRCTGTRVVFLGVAVMTKTLASELASGDSSAFVDKLVAERAAGTAGADPYAGLGNAVPTSASVGAPVACPKPFATRTALHNVECIALACQATHTVSGVDCVRTSTCLSKSVTCPAGYVKKAAYDTTASAASDSAAAATAACCERTCKSMSITCPAGKSPVAAFDTLVCADQAACDAACCRATCSNPGFSGCHQAGWRVKLGLNAILCSGNQPSSCNQMQCCDPTTCSNFLCSAGSTLDTSQPGACPSQTCTQNLCCVSMCRVCCVVPYPTPAHRQRVPEDSGGHDA